MSEMIEWRPIETAPKDRMFLGYRSHHPASDSDPEVFMGKCWYEPFSDHRDGDTEWVTGDAYSTRPGTKDREIQNKQWRNHPQPKGYSVVYLTHWMPLPKAPEDGSHKP